MHAKEKTQGQEEDTEEEGSEEEEEVVPERQRGHSCLLPKVFLLTDLDMILRPVRQQGCVRSR